MLLLGLAGVAVIMAIHGDRSDAARTKDEKVITTASGLKYVELKIGDGPEAKVRSRVAVFYTGKFENGNFDSNVGGKPYDVTIGKSRVIKGLRKSTRNESRAASTSSFHNLGMERTEARTERSRRMPRWYSKLKSRM